MNQETQPESKSVEIREMEQLVPSEGDVPLGPMGDILVLGACLSIALVEGALLVWLVMHLLAEGKPSSREDVAHSSGGAAVAASSR